MFREELRAIALQHTAPLLTAILVQGIEDGVVAVAYPIRPAKRFPCWSSTGRCLCRLAALALARSSLTYGMLVAPWPRPLRGCRDCPLAPSPLSIPNPSDWVVLLTEATSP